MFRFVLGLALGLGFGIAGSSMAAVYARVETNGILKGYTVQKNGRTVCVDPTAWNDFRGQGSFIVCPDS
ncbi:MAG: hypothetical protein Kow0026_15090 [Oricola sp.]